MLDAVKSEIIEASSDSRKLAQLAFARVLNLLIEAESYVAAVVVYGEFKDGKMYGKDNYQFKIQELVFLIKECSFLVDYVEPQLGTKMAKAIDRAVIFVINYRFEVGHALEDKTAVKTNPFYQNETSPSKVQKEMLDQLKIERKHLKKVFVKTVSISSRFKIWCENNVLGVILFLVIVSRASVCWEFLFKAMTLGLKPALQSL